MHVVDKLRILAGKRKKAEVDCLVFFVMVAREESDAKGHCLILV